MVIDFIANFLSILNTITSFLRKDNKNDNNNFEREYNHSKEIATILKNGWENPNIYYYCEFDIDDLYYYRIINSENPNIEDIPFANSHLKTGYNEIWKSKENVIRETLNLSKKIQQIIEEFKQIINQKLSEQIIDPIKQQNIIIYKETVRYYPQNDMNIYIEKNIINDIYEILMHIKKIRDDDLFIFPIKCTNSSSKTFECWKLQIKEFNPLGYGDEYIMGKLKERFLQLLKNKNLIELINNYKESKEKLDYIISNNNLINGINYIYNEIYLQGNLIKGKCSKCK